MIIGYVLIEFYSEISGRLINFLWFLFDEGLAHLIEFFSGVQ